MTDKKAVVARGTDALGTRAKTDCEFVQSWLDSLGSPHTRVNFATTAWRFLEALPTGLRAATVEDVREAGDQVGEGRGQATRRQYELRIKSLLSYAHRLGYTRFNAGVTLKVTEKNGFSVIDVTPDKLTFRVFMWRPPQPVAEIDTMQPALVYEVPRKS